MMESTPPRAPETPASTPDFAVADTDRSVDNSTSEYTAAEYRLFSENRRAVVCLLLRQVGLDAPEPGETTVPTKEQMKNMQDMENTILRIKAHKLNRQHRTRMNASRLMGTAAQHLDVMARNHRESPHQPHTHHGR